MPVSLKNGWGLMSAFLPVSSVVAGANKVTSNVGTAIQVIAGAGPVRLTKIAYRVDLAPDVVVGTVDSPTRWRVVVLAGQLPQDISSFQSQAFGAGSHPEIPQNISSGAPLPVLYDIWLDFAANDPGLNELAEIDFADAGPTVASGDTLTILIAPILDANINQALLGTSNAMMTLVAYGTGVSQNPTGGAGTGEAGSRSLPRFDSRIGG